VTAPIAGATRPERLDVSLAAPEVVLSDDEVNRLEAPYVPHAIGGYT
jgi:aryl-alcohol dehydrogenase-like predicted oxidoreductase